MSKSRLFGVVLVSLVTLALIVGVLVTVFNDELVTSFGNRFASAARVLDESFPDTVETDNAYGRILCYGYIGIIPLGLLMICCLLRVEKRRLSNIFLTLFIVLSIVADIVFWILTRKYFPIIDEVELTGDIYRLLRFIPIPVLFAGGFVRVSRVVIYYVFPLIAQILMVLPFALLRRFRTRLYEFLNFVVYLLLVAFMSVLASAILLTAIAVFLIGAILWAIKGFFTVDTGSVIRTSDGTTLHQVNGDTYSDGNGNYYTSDGSGGFRLK